MAFDNSGKMTAWTYAGKQILHTNANGTIALRELRPTSIAAETSTTTKRVPVPQM